MKELTFKIQDVILEITLWGPDHQMDGEVVIPEGAVPIEIQDDIDAAKREAETMVNDARSKVKNLTEDVMDGQRSTLLRQVEELKQTRALLQDQVAKLRDNKREMAHG